MYYGYSTTNKSADAVWSDLLTAKTYTTPKLADGTYYLFVKDYVGNISAAKSVVISNTYPITYDGNGATGGATESQTKFKGESINLRKNGFTKGDDVFSGWNTSADGSGVAYEEEYPYG